MSEELSNSVQEINEPVDVAPEAHENAEALSFDDLDELTDGRSTSDLVKELGRGNERSPQKRSSEENQLSNQTASDGQTQQEINQEIKKILAMQGEENIELNADTLFTHKVNGQDVNVNLQELLNNYSGKVSYEQKFQELHNERQELQGYEEHYNNVMDFFTSYGDKIDQHIEDNNYLAALEVFAEANDIEPYQFKRELLAALTPEMERRSILSPEEIRAEELAARNEYLSRQAEQTQSSMEEERQIQETIEHIRAVQQEYGIEDADFRWCYDQLVEVAQQEGYQDEITVDQVAQYYYEVSAYQAAYDILSETNSALANNNEVLDNLQQIIVDNPDFTEQDIVDIVNQVYGGIQQQASSNVSQKINKPSSSQQKKPSQRQYEEYVDWEDF